MGGDLPGNSFNVEEGGRGEADYSFTVDGVIGISSIDWFLQPGSGEGMLFNKPPVEAGDACTTVYEGTGVDGFQGVRWFDKLN